MRDDVDLVTDRIEKVVPEGVVTADGTVHPADAIVYGTGFKATEPLSNMTLRGRGGRELNADWKAGAEAYLGITVAGYPNLFLMMGPNTGLGHNSMIFMIEAQIHYTLQCLDLLREKGADFMDVKPQAHRGFIDEVQERIKKTVWNTGCSSWYQQSDGRNTTLWPGFTAEYWMRTRNPKEAHYSFEAADPVEAKAAAE
jgi:cation diffusion facilitator CzcD-associated flavoprotein CzcO